MTFKKFLVETKLLGDLKPYEKDIFNNYVEFLKDHFNVSKEVEISIRKPNSKAMFGYIDLVSMKQGKYKIVVKNVFGTLLGHIGHEYTHVAQFLRGDLDYTDDLSFVLWKNQPYISVKDLNKFTKDDLVKYKELPWEKEAYHNQDILPNIYKKSKFFKELKDNASGTLLFVLENI